jgi:hypothetical protein
VTLIDFTSELWGLAVLWVRGGASFDQTHSTGAVVWGRVDCDVASGFLCFSSSSQSFGSPCVSRVLHEVAYGIVVSEGVAAEWVSLRLAVRVRRTTARSLGERIMRASTLGAWFTALQRHYEQLNVCVCVCVCVCVSLDDAEAFI